MTEVSKREKGNKDETKKEQAKRRKREARIRNIGVIPRTYAQNASLSTKEGRNHLVMINPQLNDHPTVPIIRDCFNIKKANSYGSSYGEINSLLGKTVEFNDVLLFVGMDGRFDSLLGQISQRHYLLIEVGIFREENAAIYIWLNSEKKEVTRIEGGELLETESLKALRRGNEMIQEIIQEKQKAALA